MPETRTVTRTVRRTTTVTVTTQGRRQGSSTYSRDPSKATFSSSGRFNSSSFRHESPSKTRTAARRHVTLAASPHDKSYHQLKQEMKPVRHSVVRRHVNGYKPKAHVARSTILRPHLASLGPTSRLDEAAPGYGVQQALMSSAVGEETCPCQMCDCGCVVCCVPVLPLLPPFGLLTPLTTRAASIAARHT